MQNAHRNPGHRRRTAPRERGAAVLLAMMFLVIFASLATAMAIVAQGNLRTADSHLKLNRALAAADTGMRFTIFKIHAALVNGGSEFTVLQGEVDTDLAKTLWAKLRDAIALDAEDDGHNINGANGATVDEYGALTLGPIAVGSFNPNDASAELGSIPIFKAVLMQHPIPSDLPEDHPLHDHSYDSKYYRRPPYDGTKPDSGIVSAVSASQPLDERWVRVKIIAVDGPADPDTGDAIVTDSGTRAVSRSISMDFRIDKRVRAAILSKSRVMIGKNVMIEGRIGSQFLETNLEDGHPVQMESDFRELASALDDTLDVFKDDLTSYDSDFDNRLKISTEIPAEQRDAAKALDYDADGYVSDFDLFFEHFDSNGDYKVSPTELTSGGVPSARADQLVELIDSFHADDAPGDEGVIDFNDRYTKVKGEIVMAADRAGWEAGAAAEPAGSYRDYFQGPITPGHNEPGLTFGADEEQFPEINLEELDFTNYKSLANGGNVLDQAAAGEDSDPTDGSAPSVDTGGQIEPVPFGASYPYDYYERPVFENLTFRNVYIPKGTNALFKNCRFVGVTYIETETQNFIPHPQLPEANAFNYAGMQESDGSPKHPDIDAAVGNTKLLGNNIRFDGCRFEGVIVSAGPDGKAPKEFSHTRNKLTFTGNTQFPDVTKPTETPELSDEQRNLFKRGTILTPQHSVELGTFIAPQDDNETVHLSGAVMAGVLDMRGKVTIDGTVMTTFEPKSNEGPVLGETSPQFNTTLGYFSAASGDHEAEIPQTGLGLIKVRYNPNLPLPDGVRARIQVEPLVATYYEGGAQEPRTED